MKTFPGVRVKADDPRFDERGWLNGALAPGEYVKLEAPTANQDGGPVPEWVLARYPYWLAETPNGHGAALGGHTIVEHADGTITASPSIRVSTSSDGGKTRVELWHGYLEKGVWRDC